MLTLEFILTQAQSRLYGKPIGDMVRLIRIDRCRMCGHDTKTPSMEITELGLATNPTNY